MVAEIIAAGIVDGTFIVQRIFHFFLKMYRSHRGQMLRRELAVKR